MKSSFLTSLILATVLRCVRSQSSSLPQVDLGYAIQEASTYNATTQIYSFNNIRYAQPPVGELRFAPPVAPSGRNTEVQNGSFSPICPQAGPSWYPIGDAFVEAFARGEAEEFNLTQAVAEAQAQAQASNSSIADLIPPGTTEDCLVLDVVVPKAVFDSGKSMRRKRGGHSGAPVLIWIYGGGYTAGSKYQNGDFEPSGLIQSSQRNGCEGVIYVAMNYRLGALGWLSGPTLQEAGGVSNAALYDQRLALEWVRDNIHLFGGDPCQVTVMGQSAGGGSIMHQITAYAGQKPVPFQRAIIHSPGWVPITSTYIQENATQTFLQALNVSTIDEARNANSQNIIIANILTVAASKYGTFTFGPTVDGLFVPTLPGLALLNGGFAKDVNVFATHVTNEGVFFTPPNVRTDAELKAWFQSSYPGVLPQILNYVVDVLYPAVYDGTYPWRTGIERTITLVTELIFSCNTDYLARAYQNKTYNLEFEVPPAVHGIDIASIFYDGQSLNLSQAIIPPVAETFQGYITNFALTGNPNSKDLPLFPMQGMNATEVGLNATISATGIQPVSQIQQDPTANSRCRWWQKAFYL